MLMMKKLERELKFELSNQVTNGDFNTGWSGWHSYSGSIVEYNGKQCFLQTQYDHRVRQTIVSATGDIIYYGCLMAMPSDANPGNTGIKYGSDGHSRLPLEQRDGELHIVSAWRIYPGDGNHVLQIGNWSTSETTGPVYYTNVFFLNLTDIFGKGNEPTKSEMDVLFEMIGGWFDGVFVLLPKTFLLWLLQMVRSNALAITGGGGISV